MPYSTINGSNAFNWSGLWSQPNFSGSVWIPQTRAGHNGQRPIKIVNLHAFITGRFTNSAVAYAYIGGQYIGGTGLPNSGGNVSSHTTWFGGGGYLSSGSGYWDSLGINTNNRAIWMVYRNYNGLNISNSTGYVWRNKSFVGGFNFVEVPTAPSTPWINNITSSAFTVNFSGPGDNGGSNINGYRIQVATNSSFTGATSYNVSGAYRVTGLQPGTPYWIRVFAKNDMFNHYGIGSAWSGVATATTIIEPPSWTDTTLGTLMRVGTPYSDGVSAYTQKEPLTYSVSSGRLPDGITLNATTGAVAGTPTLKSIQEGPTYDFSIRATNAGGINTATFSRTVVPELSSWEDNVLQTEMRVALPYSDSISATGTGIEYSVGPLGAEPRPNTYQVVPGVTLDRVTGIVSGIPTTAGSYNVTIFATNDSGGFAEQQFVIIVKPTGKRYGTKTTTEYLQTIRRWDGQEWQDVSIIRKWDGTKWSVLEMQ